MQSNFVTRCQFDEHLTIDFCRRIFFPGIITAIYSPEHTVQACKTHAFYVGTCTTIKRLNHPQLWFSVSVHVQMNGNTTTSFYIFIQQNGLPQNLQIGFSCHVPIQRVVYFHTHIFLLSIHRVKQFLPLVKVKINSWNENASRKGLQHRLLTVLLYYKHVSL